MNEKTKNRAELLQNGTYKHYKMVKKTAWKNENDIKEFQLNEQGEVTGYDFNQELFGMPLETIKECHRMEECRKKQRQKVQEHVEWLSDRGYNLAFITLTFTDEALKLSKKTRKKRVTQVLTQFDDFITNIDYGENTEREHYHAIIALKTPLTDYRNDYNKPKNNILDTYKLGTYDLEEVRMEGDFKEKLSNYLAKLTSHSMKVQQQYISTKKGTPYQEWKTAQEQKKKAWNRHLKRTRDH